MSLNKLHWENYYWQAGHKFIAGVDEAGRGAWAGPVVAAAVIFSAFQPAIPDIDDSKKLTPTKRENLFELIRREALAVGVGIMPASLIDEINILQASLLAMKQAVANLAVQPSLVLVDGNAKIPFELKQKTLIGGDGLSQSIGAASIIAKVTRDRLMVELDKLFPNYEFAKHKGYGTKDHQLALKNFGILECHRKSYAPIKKIRSADQNSPS